MNQRTSRKQQKAATRRALKAAARTVLVERGSAGASVADVTRAAGVAQGTFYVHFDSKDALVGELVADFNASLAARLAPLWQPRDGLDVPATVRETARIFLAAWREHRGFIEAAAHRFAAGMDLATLRDGLNPQVGGLLQTQLTALAAARGRQVAAPHLVVQGLLAMWLRVGMQHLFSGDPDGDGAAERDAATLATMTLGALEAVLGEPQRGTP